MKKTNAITILAALVYFYCGTRIEAVEINGTVRSSADKSATVTTTSDVMPASGDKAAIFFKIAGTDDEISVAKGHVSEVRGSDIILAIDDATGDVSPGQLVRVTSESPVPRSETAPSPSAVATPLVSSTPVPQPSSGSLPPSPPSAADAGLESGVPPPPVDRGPASAPPPRPSVAAPRTPPKASRPIPSPTPASRFEGRWKTHDENGTYYLDLHQHGNRVSGNYTLQGGSFSGTIRGNRIVGTWRQSGNRLGGTAQLELSADGQTLSGPWQYDPTMYGSGQTGGGVWTMQRMGR